MTENWRPYPNDPRYQVSDHGRVIGPKGQLICPEAGKHYPRTSIKGKKVYIHVMVLETFVGPRPDGMETCHLDDVRTNNHLSNLRWGTHADNMGDQVRNGGHPAANKVVCKRGHKLEGLNLKSSRNSGVGRCCRSCHYATQAINKAMRTQGVDITDQVDELADGYYERIMSDVVG